MAKSTTTPPVIELRGLSKTYGFGDAARTVLDDISLTIKKGEFVAIMGPSGCGKTTLLNILGLLDRPDDGEYLLDGNQVNKLSNAKHAQIRARQIGTIFQSFNLINRLTVIDNVALPLTYSGMRRTKRLMAASEILKRFHLQEREYYMPWQLSGGQMQRVAIARALVSKPSLILADEPTGNLDSRSSHVIMQELSDLHQRGNTIIMVTHNPNLTTYASRVITMIDGKIESDSKTDAKKKTAKKSTSRSSKRQAKKTARAKK
jgi:putative ABC transport system ATP-binding protein